MASNSKQNIVTFDASIKTAKRVFDGTWGNDARYALVCDVISDPTDNSRARFDTILVVNDTTKVTYRGWNKGNVEVKASMRSLYDGINEGAKGSCGLKATVTAHVAVNGTLAVKSITVEAEVFDGILEKTDDILGCLWFKYDNERINTQATTVAYREMRNVGAFAQEKCRFVVLCTGDVNRLVLVTARKTK